MKQRAIIHAIAAITAVAACAVPSGALARPGMHNFHLELNGAYAVGDQSDRFDWGGGGGISYGFAPIPYLEIQAGYHADFFNALQDGSPGYGAFHGLGLALAVHFTPYFEVGDLWIAAGGDVAFTGDVVRPAINVRAGFDFNVHWAFRIGPFIGFHHVFQTDADEAMLGQGDASFLTFGINMSFLGEEDEETAGDQDDDGIADDDDDCVNRAEDLDDFEDEDGCPEDDNDGDGVLDADDACPNRSTVGRPDEDGDGCADEAGDSDGDGIADLSDGCPGAAEDRDGFQDEDGCPDTDNDGDSLPDASDQCPDEAETQNGFDDSDGCPDEAPEQEALTEIGARILFPRASARPTGATRGAIQEVASFLNAHPEVLEIQLEGHASSTGNQDFNLRLSRQRAERVRNLLIGQGVEGDRLTIVAHGSARASDDAAQDRRVSFTIVRRAE